MIVYSMEYGIKRYFDSARSKEIVKEFIRIQESESILYDAEYSDTIEILDLILHSQNWIDKNFIYRLIDDLMNIRYERDKMKKQLDKYYIEYGELEND